MKQGDGVTKASEGKQQQQQQPAAAEPEREPTKEELEAEFDPNDAGTCRKTKGKPPFQGERNDEQVCVIMLL